MGPVAVVGGRTRVDQRDGGGKVSSKLSRRSYEPLLYLDSYRERDGTVSRISGFNNITGCRTRGKEETGGEVGGGGRGAPRRRRRVKKGLYGTGVYGCAERGVNKVKSEFTVKGRSGVDRG